jgi:hypothetical protein
MMVVVPVNCVIYIGCTLLILLSCWSRGLDSCVHIKKQYTCHTHYNILAADLLFLTFQLCDTVYDSQTDRRVR